MQLTAWQAVGGAYRLALLMLAVVALTGLVDIWRLPRGAGDHFVDRR